MTMTITQVMSEAEAMDLLEQVIAGLERRVFDHQVIGLHSEAVAEDGRILRLFDLVDGRTGMQCFVPGEPPGAIVFAD